MISGEENKTAANTTQGFGLPCEFCRHRDLCKLWEDGREVCESFSSQNMK